MAENKPLFARMQQGLSKTRANIAGMLGQVFNRPALGADFFDELEEALIMADMGVATSGALIEELRERMKQDKIDNADAARAALQALIEGRIRCDTPFLPQGKAAVVLVVGVNGVGKTTAIGKMAAWYTREGRKVVLAAGDTFRAAAAEQLTVWGERAGVGVVRHGEGADPAAVVFDAIQSAKAKQADLLICDTAGRLHNKKNLMEELKKIGRLIEREMPDALKEVLLVLDATTGQNAVLQAKQFAEAVPLSGIILTKLDGTAKGGVVVALQSECAIPVRFVGTGEGLDDLLPFDAAVFAQALLQA